MTPITEDKNKFEGLWFYYYHMWFQSGPLQSGFSPRWITIFDNGEAYEDLPNGGYLHFEKDASKENKDQAVYWGTYTVNGNQCTIVRPGSTYPRKLTFIKENQVQLDTGEHAFRVPNVDGLGLEGFWTSSSDPSRKFLNHFKDGEKPLIAFSKGGTFRDYGQFNNEFVASRRSAGEGTYEIKNYTLVLTYDNQPSVELAFSFFAKDRDDLLSSHSSLIFLNRATLMRAEQQVDDGTTR